MKWLSRYLQQVFCAHNFKISESSNVEIHSWSYTEGGVRQNFTCEKCGHSYNKWKFM